MRLLGLLAAAVLGCSMQSNGARVETEPKRVEKSDAPADKTAEKAPRPERKMTEQAKAALDQLSDSNASEPERLKAARQLAELEDPATVAPMAGMLQLEISEVLAAEIRKALDLMGATQVLIEDLAQADDFGRAAAASLLARLNDRAAIDPLIRALSDRAPKVRESAAATLGFMKAKEAEAALVLRLTKDEAPDVRGAAAQALGLLKTESAKAALQQALATEQDGFVKVLIEGALR